ncbi:RNA dependent RNA polymerase-domain-containing protein [Phaeosphaeriaceae sp. PMI808]|nr:RNA dependent RNA polymerase-domain-containing protein [Phaeosphaeriaceae sp. PMI808]
MAPPVRGLNSVNTNPALHTLTSANHQDQLAPSHLTYQNNQAYSERSSENSPNSVASFNSRTGSNMNHRNGNYQRGGRGDRNRRRGGRGGSRTYSGSSGSSGGQVHNRPVLRSSSATESQANTSYSHHQDSAQANAPVTPTRNNRTLTMSDYTIHEFHTARENTSTLSRASSTPSTPTSRNDRSRNTPDGSRVMHRPIKGNKTRDWAHRQEHRIKLLGIFKTSWTKDVYQTMSQYGHVVRINIQPGSYDNKAWVTYRPFSQQIIPDKLNVAGSLTTWEELNPVVRTVPSPINPAREYYEVNVLSANSIAFGTKDAALSMTIMHVVENCGKVQLMLNLDRKELDIQFSMKAGDQKRMYKFRLPIALLSRIYKNANAIPGQTALIIPFDSPPQFFVRKYEGEHLSNGAAHTNFSAKERNWSDWNTWFRETDVVDTSSRQALQQRPLMNHNNDAIIDIGRWTNYRLLFDNNMLTGAQYEDFARALADHGVAIENCSQYTTKGRPAFSLWGLLQDEISGTHSHLESSYKTSGFEALCAGQVHLDFPVRYQLEACLSNGFLKENNITEEFLRRLASLHPRRATCILETVFEKEVVYYDPTKIFDITLKDRREKVVPDHCATQRSVTITPTMIHVASPSVDTSNRITRKHAADSDMPNDKAKALFDRIRRAMENGVIVAGRYYEFLAYGNSQFREHGAYFYAPTSSKSASDIRVSLGQFDHIKTTAKFGARLGQCFSTTRPMSIKVKEVPIPDIERNGYCFTDGVGKMSKFIAQMAARDLGLSNAFEDPPSLFQFRLGGCKGVLALDPNISGDEVHIRPSQRKFDASYTGLEIIRSSTLSTPFLNRQIIIVLSGLGVDDKIFIKKQQDMVYDYEQAMTDKEMATVKLRKHIDMNQTTLTMAGMVLDGFMESREPFMMSLLQLWRAFTIKNLKEKARIAVDGAFVLGCVDETTTLKGHLNNAQSSFEATRDQKLANLPEIFLQIDDTNNKGHYKIIKGICILARNPSLYPSDLRIVRATDVLALHHLKNVVVFPQTGDRDLANMCSGGDLDGDDYMVLWDIDLMPYLVNVPPIDFAPNPEKPTEKTEPITVEDLIDFFITYMQNDSLGQIAHAHLAQADKKGIHNKTALSLARLHSQAVDYPKSGVPAQMSRDLKPTTWPHFMEKKFIRPSQTYKSEKILGQLYDQIELVDFKPQWNSDSQTQTGLGMLAMNSFDSRILGAYHFEEKDDIYIKATGIKTSYDEDLKRLMAKHGICTEFEAWSVFVLSHNHESRDYKFAEEFGRTIGAFKSKYRKICSDAAKTIPADILKFVAAMYTVTARDMEAALEKCNMIPPQPMDSKHMPLMSFVWIFPQELGKIATEGRQEAAPSHVHI